MEKSFFMSACLLVQLSLLSSVSFAASEYTVGGSYRFNGQNTFSSASTFNLGLILIGSVLFDEKHEVGTSFQYNINWEENSKSGIVSEASTFSPSLFYRHHFFMTDENTRFPILVYLGPDIGMYKVRYPFHSSSLNWGGGASLGFNLFLSKNISLDLLLLSAQRVFKIKRDIFNQSVGVRFYFE